MVMQKSFDGMKQCERRTSCSGLPHGEHLGGGKTWTSAHRYVCLYWSIYV